MNSRPQQAEHGSNLTNLTICKRTETSAEVSRLLLCVTMTHSLHSLQYPLIFLL